MILTQSYPVFAPTHSTITEPQGREGQKREKSEKGASAVSSSVPFPFRATRISSGGQDPEEESLEQRASPVQAEGSGGREEDEPLGC